MRLLFSYKLINTLRLFNNDHYTQFGTKENLNAISMLKIYFEKTKTKTNDRKWLVDLLNGFNYYWRKYLTYLCMQ